MCGWLDGAICMTDKAQKAQMLYDAGLYRQADALVREAIAECPANAECFRLMSYVDLQLNRRTQAVQSARTAVSLAPDDYEVYVCLAFALYRSYQFEEAMHAAETALELCPDYAYGMAVASSIKQSLNDKEGALQYAELGLAIDPDCDSCLKRKAFALRSLNRIAEAEAVEKNCLELDPNDMFNHISRGFGAARSEDLDGMFEHFENALRLEPDNPTAHYAMACGFLREGNFAKAEEHARNAYQSDVDDVDAALLLADVLVSSHQVTKALEILELALKKYPEHEGLHVKICEIALDTLYWNLAESTARHLLKLHNNHFVAIFTLMRCCQSYGKVQEIDTLLERFLKDNTDTEEAYHLRILREHIRGDALALEQIAQEGLVLYPDDDYIKWTLGKAMYMADGTAIKQKEAMEENGFFSDIVSSSATCTIMCDSIKLDEHSRKFTYYGTQSIRRRTKKIRRTLITTGALENVPRTQNNPHGLLITHWRTLKNIDLEY